MQLHAIPDTHPEPSAESAQVPRSTLVGRNVTISGHRTSVRLEPEMWSGLSEICRRERTSLHEVCTSVSTHKTDNTSLTAAIRVFVMSYYRTAATEDGHIKAGHGYGTAMMPTSARVMPITRPTTPSPFMIGSRINGTDGGMQ